MSVFRNMLWDSLQHGGPCFGGKLFTAAIVVGKLTKLLHSQTTKRRNVLPGLYSTLLLG